MQDLVVAHGAAPAPQLLQSKDAMTLYRTSRLPGTATICCPGWNIRRALKLGLADVARSAVVTAAPSAVEGPRRYGVPEVGTS